MRGFCIAVWGGVSCGGGGGEVGVAPVHVVVWLCAGNEVGSGVSGRVVLATVGVS